MKDELMKLWIEAEVNRLTNLRAGAARKMGTPGPEGSTGKLAYAESNKRIYEFTMNLMPKNLQSQCVAHVASSSRWL